MASPLTSIQAVLFDFDGVLVDSEPLHYRCWMQVVKPYGGHMAWPEYKRRLTGQTDLLAAEILLTEAGKSPTPEIMQQAWDAKRAAFQDCFCDELTIPSEIHLWIKEHAHNLKVGVVSSSMTSEVEPLLIRSDIREHLDVLVCGDQVRRHKPDPEPYLTALARLNSRRSDRVKAEECLVVEDSQAGIAAAKAAGMHVEAVKSTVDVLPALRGAIPDAF